VVSFPCRCCLRGKQLLSRALELGSPIWASRRRCGRLANNEFKGPSVLKSLQAGRETEFRSQHTKAYTLITRHSYGYPGYPGVFGRFDLAALAQPHLEFLVCLLPSREVEVC
jgi:hypothetical protein